MKKLKWLAFICWVLLCNRGYTQNQPLYFEHITSEEGLSQNDVNCIYQDSKGFMWFGTHDGLNKYDGNNFTIYKPDPNDPHSISSNLIFSITEDLQGNLWIGTTGAGIHKFDRKTEKFTQYKHHPDKPQSLSNDYVVTSYVDKYGNVWVGTQNGLNKIEIDAHGNYPDTITHFFADPNNPHSLTNNNINSIYEDHLGVIWIGTENGLNSMMLTGTVPKFTHYDALDASSVRSVKEDEGGNLFISTDQGLFYATSEDIATGNRFHKVATGSFRSLTIDNQGKIWVGSDVGVYRFEKRRNTMIPQLEGHYANEVQNPNSLSKNLIRSIYQDHTGIMWIGTNGGGVNKYVPENNKFRHFLKTPYPGSISYNKIRSIFEDSEGTLWIGTEGGGLNRLPAGKGKGNYSGFEHFDAPKRVFAFTETAKDNKRRLWIGSEDHNSLSYISLNTKKGAQLPEINLGVNHDFELENSVFTLLEDHHGALWVGSYNGGLFKLVPDATGAYHEVSYFKHKPGDESSISNNIIRNLLEDRHGNLWIGTGDGLNKIAKEELNSGHPTFKRYENVPGDTTSISHNYILAMYESEAGDLWIGTFGGGLNRLVEGEGTEGFVQYGEKDGLPNDVVKGILEDDAGNLWIATNKGLSRFNPATETFKNYDVSDGLQSNEFSELACFKRKDGEMLFGGVNGFNAFYPDSIRDNPHVPQIAITDFEILNEPVIVGEKKNGRVILEHAITETNRLPLRYFENSFSFGFSALHYAAPSKNQYAYMLEGFDKDWVYTTARRPFATYTNLRHGEYIFKVKASNNDGIWNETPVSLNITIAPPFWLTWWAYVFYAVVFLIALWVFWKYTLIDIHRKHQLELEHLEIEKTEELHQMKLRFFTNISHEFRTPLTLILGPLEQLLKSEETLASGERKNQYGLMHKNAKYLLRLVHQLMDFRKMDQGKMPLKVVKGNMVQFVSEITEPFQFIANKKNIEFRVQANADEIFLWFDEDKVEKIMHNLLSNAFKFTPENGLIQVVISTHKTGEKGAKDHIVMSVQDSGPGILPSQKEHIFERFYQAKTYEKPIEGGAGIGLSFTKSLVELHHGQISVESQEGEGTLFKVMLPMDKDHFRKEDFADVKAENIKNETRREVYEWNEHEEVFTDRAYVMPKGKNFPLLLIIDDHAEIRQFIRQNFEQDYNIIEAENGVKGLKVAVNTTPDLIIGDIMMPEMNGLEMCHQLKNDPRTSHIPIILLTAKDTEENELEGLKTGADQYITKPFNVELLQVSVSNLIRSRQNLRKKFTREIALEPAEVTVTATDEDFLKKAMTVVEEHMEDTEFSVEILVKELGISRSNLYQKIKALTDLSTSEFIRTIRMKRAVQLLENSDLSVKEIMYQSGFNTASYFSKCFKKQFGMIPSEYVKKKLDKEEIL